MLVKLSEQEDILRYHETLIASKSATLDRTNQEELNKFNNMMEDYRKFLFSTYSDIPKDDDGKKVDLDAIMKEKQKKLNTKLDFKKANTIKKEFASMDLKTLIAEGK